MSGSEGPAWEEQLRSWVEAYVGGSASSKEDALQSLVMHVDAAYRRGLLAGRSQAGYGTRRKPSPSAPSADGSSASAPEPAG